MESEADIPSRASRTVWIAVRCPGINDAIARPADSAIVGPKSYHRRCVDAVGQLVRARGGGEERCWGAADAAVDCAGALLAVGFPVLLYMEIKVSLVSGSRV